MFYVEQFQGVILFLKSLLTTSGCRVVCFARRQDTAKVVRVGIIGFVIKVFGSPAEDKGRLTLVSFLPD